MGCLLGIEGITWRALALRCGSSPKNTQDYTSHSQSFGLRLTDRSRDRLGYEDLVGVGANPNALLVALLNAQLDSSTLIDVPLYDHVRFEAEINGHFLVIIGTSWALNNSIAV